MTTVECGRVLVVDDDELVLDTVEKLLARFGHEVCTATRVEAAVPLLEEHASEVMILDLRLPGQDGLEWLQALPREGGPEVIIMTGFATMGTAQQAMRLGVCGYLEKPAAPHELFESVAEALERHRRRMQAAARGRRLETLLERLPVGVVETSQAGRVRFCNRRAAGMLGYEVEEYTGLQVRDLYVDPSDRDKLEAALERHGRHSFECPLRHRDGATVWVRGTSQLVEQYGEPTYLGVFEDISRERKLAATLERREQELHELKDRIAAASKVARAAVLHQLYDTLGGPLRGLDRDLAALIRCSERGGTEWPQRIRHLRRMASAALEALQGLTREDGPGPAAIGLRAALLEEVDRVCREGGITVDSRIEPGEGEVEKDVVSSLCHILRDLLDEVRRHAVRPRVRVEAEGAQGELRLEVWCIGSSTAGAEGRAALRASAARARRVLRGLEGALEFTESERSSLVRITLPLRQGVASCWARERAALLASDGVLPRRALRHLLEERLGVHVCEVASVRGLKERVYGAAWDVVVVDVCMLAGRTVDLLRWIHLEQRQAGIVVVAWGPGGVRVADVLAAGARACMTRGCSEQDWLEAVEAVLAGRTHVAPGLSAELTGEGRALHDSLTEREFAVLCGIGQGMNVKQLAEAAGRSEITVRKTRRNLLKKMRMKTDGDVIRYALRHELVD